MLLAEQLARNPDLRGHAFNFSNESQITVLQLIQRIASVMKSSIAPDIRNEASNEIREQYLDASKAKNMLGWKPLFDLDLGLVRTIEWYREHLSYE